MATSTPNRSDVREGIQPHFQKKGEKPGKLLDSRLGYYIRRGKHSMTREDWKVFLDFADKTPWVSRPI